jgi:hypothetical protein
LNFHLSFLFRRTYINKASCNQWYPRFDETWHGILLYYFLGLHNKISQSGCFKTAEIYYFTALEFKSPTSSYREGQALPETHMAQSFLASGGLLAFPD